jgi:hypothetical protein
MIIIPSYYYYYYYIHISKEIYCRLIAYAGYSVDIEIERRR